MTAPPILHNLIASPILCAEDRSTIKALLDLVHSIEVSDDTSDDKNNYMVIGNVERESLVWLGVELPKRKNQ